MYGISYFYNPTSNALMLSRSFQTFLYCGRIYAHCARGTPLAQTHFFPKVNHHIKCLVSLESSNYREKYEIAPRVLPRSPTTMFFFCPEWLEEMMRFCKYFDLQSYEIIPDSTKSHNFGIFENYMAI